MTSDSNAPMTVVLLEQQMHSGLHIGAQLYVSRNRQVVMDTAIGEARGGVAMTTDSIIAWMSGGKPITAVAIAQLWESGLISLDDAVAKFVPEFAQNGKEAITVRHCLTHTGGFRGPMNNFTPGTWEEIIARICAMRQEANWVPGEKAGYHVATSWFVLAEIVQRVSGVKFDRYVREKIFSPLGMRDAWMGINRSHDRIAMLPTMKDGGADFSSPVNSEELNAMPRPGANFRCPANQFGWFYEFLLGASDTEVLTAQTIEAMVCPHRVYMLDHTFNSYIDWSLGFLVNSAPYDPTRPYAYGPHASRWTFGHSGNQSSVAFADPQHRLAVALAFNGMPGEAVHQERVGEVLTLLYEELGLARQ